MLRFRYTLAQLLLLQVLAVLVAMMFASDGAGAPRQRIAALHFADPARLIVVRHDAREASGASATGLTSVHRTVSVLEAPTLRPLSIVGQDRWNGSGAMAGHAFLSPPTVIHGGVDEVTVSPFAGVVGCPPRPGGLEAKSSALRAVARSSSVDLIHLKTELPPRTLSLAANVTFVAFSPDESRLAVGCDDGSVTLLDPATGDRLASVSAPGRFRWPWTWPAALIFVWAFVWWRVRKYQWRPRSRWSTQSPATHGFWPSLRQAGRRLWTAVTS